MKIICEFLIHSYIYSLINGKFENCKTSANKGGTIAGNTRKEIEKEINKPVITSKNAKELHFNKKKKLK